MIFPSAVPLEKPGAFLDGAHVGYWSNSIGATTFSSTPIVEHLRQILERDYGTNITTQNYSVDGQHTRDLIASANTNLIGGRRLDRRNIAIIHEGSNDLYFYDLATTNRVQLAAGNLRDLCRRAQLSGWYVVLMGCCPRANGYPPGTTNPTQYTADINALNAILEATWYEFADLYFDFRRHLPYYVAANPYAPDGVHPQQYGCAMIAAHLARYLVQSIG
jgi:lysophospholipase L1-like esterase